MIFCGSDFLQCYVSSDYSPDGTSPDLFPRVTEYVAEGYPPYILGGFDSRNIKSEFTPQDARGIDLSVVRVEETPSPSSASAQSSDPPSSDDGKFQFLYI